MSNLFRSLSLAGNSRDNPPVDTRGSLQPHQTSPRIKQLQALLSAAVAAGRLSEAARLIHELDLLLLPSQLAARDNEHRCPPHPPLAFLAPHSFRRSAPHRTSDPQPVLNWLRKVRLTQDRSEEQDFGRLISTPQATATSSPGVQRACPPEQSSLIACVSGYLAGITILMHSPHAPRQVSEMHKQMGHALPPKVATRRAIVQKAFAVARRAAQV